MPLTNERFIELYAKSKDAHRPLNAVEAAEVFEEIVYWQQLYLKEKKINESATPHPTTSTAQQVAYSSELQKRTSDILGSIKFDLHGKR